MTVVLEAPITRKLTAYEIALSKVRGMISAHQALKVRWIGGYNFEVQSSSNPREFHTVTFKGFESLIGASCSCKAHAHECCIHRAFAYFRVINFLGTAKGAQWYEQILKQEAQKRAPILCSECGLLPIAHNKTDLCGSCIDENYTQEAYERFAASNFR